jgi:multidrug efflux pump subunit AcrA (membrane-fusion protein)
MPKMPMNASSTQGGFPQGTSGQAMPAMPAGGMFPGGMTNDPKTKTVWVKDPKMTLRPARIKVGIDNGTNVEVISGLNEGDEVIISMGTGKAATTTKKTDNGPRGPFPF